MNIGMSLGYIWEYVRVYISICMYIHTYVYIYIYVNQLLYNVIYIYRYTYTKKDNITQHRITCSTHRWSWAAFHEDHAAEGNGPHASDGFCRFCWALDWTCKFLCLAMFDYLLGGIPAPLKKIWVRQLGWLFHIYWKNKACSSHHRPVMFGPKTQEKTPSTIRVKARSRPQGMRKMGVPLYCKGTKLGLLCRRLSRSKEWWVVDRFYNTEAWSESARLDQGKPGLVVKIM